MPRNFSIEQIENKETKNKKITRRVVRIKATNKDKISYKDIVKFYNAMIQSGHDKNKVSIRAMAPDKVYTIKAFEVDDIPEFDADEYYENRAEDTSKFSEYFFCDFVIHE